VGSPHHGFKTLVDFLLGPVEAGEVLHPLEIADRDAAGIGQDVGNDQGAVGGKNVVGFGGGGAVGALDDDLGAYRVGIVFVQLAFQRGGDQQFGFQRPEFGGRQDVGVGGAGHTAMFFDMLEQRQDIEAAVIVHATGVV